MEQNQANNTTMQENNTTQTFQHSDHSPRSINVSHPSDNSSDLKSLSHHNSHITTSSSLYNTSNQMQNNSDEIKVDNIQSEHITGSNPNNTENETKTTNNEINTSLLPPLKAKTSKYDYVKVRVWLNEHYHVLSRYLITRMLLVTQLPTESAITIALHLKKLLVDSNHLDVTLQQLHEYLWFLLQEYGYGTAYFSRYQLLMNFHYQQRPIIVLIYGNNFTGKAQIARRLANRMNWTNVVQTKVKCTRHETFETQKVTSLIVDCHLIVSAVVLFCFVFSMFIPSVVVFLLPCLLFLFHYCHFLVSLPSTMNIILVVVVYYVVYGLMSRNVVEKENH